MERVGDGIYCPFAKSVEIFAVTGDRPAFIKRFLEKMNYPKPLNYQHQRVPPSSATPRQPLNGWLQTTAERWRLRT